MFDEKTGVQKSRETVTLNANIFVVNNFKNKTKR
jgi:hypothetical protein